MLPLRWDVGDRCAVAGRVGVVARVYVGFVKVYFDDRPYVGECIALAKLELVPFAKAAE